MCHRFGVQRREHRPEAGPSNAPMTIEVTCGGMLCELHYWSEAEWASLPEADRPAEAAHAPGVGWIGAVPVAGLN